MRIIGSSLLLLAALACGGQDPTLSSSAEAARGDKPAVKKIFEAERMVGVPRPYTGAASAIRGVPGGGLPWVIEEGEAKIYEDGTVDVKVERLVFDPNDQAVIDRGLANQNTVASFKAIVSCQSIGPGPTATVVNVETALFPATVGLGGGDAHIVQQLALPSPCIAPIVFVTSPAGSWFAATAL